MQAAFSRYALNVGFITSVAVVNDYCTVYEVHTPNHVTPMPAGEFNESFQPSKHFPQPPVSCNPYAFSLIACLFFPEFSGAA